MLNIDAVHLVLQELLSSQLEKRIAQSESLFNASMGLTVSPRSSLSGSVSAPTVATSQTIVRREHKNTVKRGGSELLSFRFRRFLFLGCPPQVQSLLERVLVEVLVEEVVLKGLFLRFLLTYTWSSSRF